MIHHVAFLKVLLQLTLFGIFLYLFGVPSYRRYHESKVMTVVRLEKTGGIPAPAVTICSKIEGKSQIVSDACNGTDNVFGCMESQMWASKEDIVLDAQRGFPKKKSLMGSEFWEVQFKLKFYCFTFSMDEKISPNDTTDWLNFVVNKDMNYEFFVHSYDYFIPNYNPLLLPINRFKVFGDQDCNSFVTISLVEKYELSTADDPCEASPDYSYSQCVKESVYKQVG